MPVVIGVDPSSRKLAAISCVVGMEDSAVYHLKSIPVDKPTACLMAFEWARMIVGANAPHATHAFVELPVLGRGGPGSTIPQAQINGALLAGFQIAGSIVTPVNNSRAKKQVIGRGNANKEDIREWVEENWPSLYESIGGDQDLCDSAMIYQFGKAVLARRDRLSKHPSLDGVSIKRRGKVTPK